MVGIAALLFASLFIVTGASAEIRIGFQAPMTGFAAEDGKLCKVAAEMAVDKINSSGGVLGQSLKIFLYDDQAKADQAIPIANKLIGQDKVQFAISGSYSGPSRAAATIFQKAKIPYVVAYAVHPDITKAGNYVFRLEFLGPVQGRGGAKFVGDNLGLKRISVIIMDNDYGVSTAEGFIEASEKFGIKIINQYTYSLKDRQFGSIIAKLKVDKPEGIYITAYPFTAGPLVSQIRAAGIKAAIIGSQAFDAKKFLDIAGKTAEGVYNVAGFDRDQEDPEVQKIMKEFLERAKYPIINVAATTYSSIMLMADAIKRAGTTDPEKVRNAIAATKDFRLLTGLLSNFNKLGELNKPMNVNIIRDGKFRSFTYVNDLELLKPPEK